MFSPPVVTAGIRAEAPGANQILPKRLMTLFAVGLRGGTSVSFEVHLDGTKGHARLIGDSLVGEPCGSQGLDLLFFLGCHIVPPDGIVKMVPLP